MFNQIRVCRHWAIALGLAVLLLTQIAAAEKERVRGYVVAVQGPDLVIDLAQPSGVLAGTQVQIWRPVTVRHPVTGRTLKDEFLIGVLKVTQVRENLSLARPTAKLHREPEAGDVVVFEREVAAAPTPEPEPAATEAQAEVADPWKVPAAKAPTDLSPTPYPENKTKKEEPPPVRVLGHDKPTSLDLGRPFTMAINVTGAHDGLLLHYRTQGTPSYKTTPLRSAGVSYYTATVAGEDVRGDALEYFIEATIPSGGDEALVGSADKPVKVPLRPLPGLVEPSPPALTAKIWSDFADYNRLRGNDWAWQTEGEFGLRFVDKGLRAVRSGFGVYRGVGGSVEELDEQKLFARKTGLTYGYLEGEWGFTPAFSLIGRAIFGLEAEGLARGVQWHVRFGSDRETNLTVGGELLGSVGVKGITQLQIDPQSRFPVLLRSEVTDQPAGSAIEPGTARPSNPSAPSDQISTGDGDIGVRGIAQVGYRILPELVVSLRASYQGRNIKHSGPGVGGGLELSW